MRHGEAAHVTPDIERPLNERGINGAIKAARETVAKGFVLDQLFHSSAVRTSMTAEYFAQVNRLDPDRMVSKHEFYQMTVGGLLQAINNFDNRWETVGIIAHNPTISYLVEYLATNAEQFNFGTADIAVIEFEASSWLEIAQLTGELVWHYTGHGA